MFFFKTANILPNQIQYMPIDRTTFIFCNRMQFIQCVLLYTKTEVPPIIH